MKQEFPPTGDPAGGARAPHANRPILVVGCPRSGTTLLQLMLSAHPRIAIPPENRFVLEAWQRRDELGDLGDPAHHAALADWITATPKFRDLGVAADTVREAVLQAPATLGASLAAVLAEYARAQGKPRWGDKRPLYLNHMRALLRLFPDAQFVHIIRDGRDCVASLKRMPWWKTGSVSAISRWVHSMRLGRRGRSALRPDQYHELQYEHLVAAPRQELERLCAFLGEEFAESMLEHHRAAPVAPGYKTWHTRTSEAVSTAAVNQWRGQLEPWELAVMERVGRRHLLAYGYELSGERHSAPLMKVLQARTQVARRWLRHLVDDRTAGA